MVNNRCNSQNKIQVNSLIIRLKCEVHLHKIATMFVMSQVHQMQKYGAATSESLLHRTDHPKMTRFIEAAMSAEGFKNGYLEALICSGKKL